MATYPIRQLADNGGTAQFVPVTAPEAVQFPDGSNLNTLIGSIATIESNPVAANHAVGEFLCINGQVYEVIDAITAGDSIALGENVQAANLGSQITALNKGLIHYKTFTNSAAIVVPNRNANYPWSDIDFNGVVSSGETFVGAYFYLTVQTDGIGGSVFYNTSERKIVLSLTNMFSSDQTIQADALTVVVMYLA